jgi:hypothetical protein
MNQIHNLQAFAKLIKTLDFSQFAEDYNDITEANINMTDKIKKLESMNMKLTETNTKLNSELETLTEKLQIKTDDVTNLTKVSIVQTLSKQVNEKDNMIRILESQLEKYKNKKVETENVSEVEEKPKKIKEEVVVEEKPKKIKEEVVVEEKPKKSAKEEIVNDFDPDNFEEINGFELMMYKKKYYLRDLETNELYSIMNNVQDKVVGFINSSGKPKFSNS